MITSRPGAGRTVDRHGVAGTHRDRVRLGGWFADGLNEQEARIKLMAVLGAGESKKTFAP